MDSNTSKDAALCYSQMMTTQKEDGIKLMERFVNNYLKGKYVLDLGCGTGNLSSILAEKLGEAGKVIAVDPDCERIRLAKEQYGSNGNLEFIVGDDQSFPGGSFDGVFCNTVIHWIKDKNATFKKIYNNLKPGAFFAFSTQDNPNPEILMEILSVFDQETIKTTLETLHWESADYYKQLATSNGFEVVFMEVTKRSFTFPDIDAVINFFFGVFHGKFDRSSPALNEVKKKYEGKSIVITIPRLTAMLKKPNTSC